MSPIEQLDLVARTRSNQRLISYLRIVFPAVSVFSTILASESEAPRLETQLVTAMAVGLAITSVILWSSWRHKLYSVAVFCFAFAMINVLSNDHPRHSTVLGWIASRSLSFLFIYYGVGMWIIARRYSTVNKTDWQVERARLDNWMQTLNNPSTADTIDFPAGSFWTGYWTYRIFNTGNCWLVATFKRGTSKLVKCRVVEFKDVVFTHSPAGKWNIDITEKNKTKSFTEVEISRPLPAAFEPFVRHVLA